MPFDKSRPFEPCIVCKSSANILTREFNIASVVDCSRCGDFKVSKEAVEDVPLPFNKPEDIALASHIIRRMQTSGERTVLTKEFFDALRLRTLPRPAELMDNLIVEFAENTKGGPGKKMQISFAQPGLQATVGAVGTDDISWVVESLKSQGLLDGSSNPQLFIGTLTPRGWQRFEELKRADVSSKFAFFARKFQNPELDQVFENCLRPAVEQTGYELRTATQRAGLVDAIIEDEIRRCRFLIADLSDDNAGAYWEAGFAEGLGKDVIYVCRAKDDGQEKKTHFDANHRQTVRWDLNALNETATKLKAVIRNTLLGDAMQTD